MLSLTWLAGLLRRRTGRMVGETAGIAVAVLLLASLGTFFTAIRATMTRLAVGSVPVDWQVQIRPGTHAAKAAAVVVGAPGVTAAVPVSYAETSGLSSRVAGTVRTTGPGKILGLAPGLRPRSPVRSITSWACTTACYSHSRRRRTWA